jgi:hypothetical protein
MADQIFVATTSGASENKKTGESAVFVKGITRVREGHWLLKQVPYAFEPADEHVHYDIEQATAAPGEKRAAKPAKPEPVEKPEPAADPEPPAEPEGSKGLTLSSLGKT